jgi:hypothetical protein
LFNKGEKEKQSFARVSSKLKHSKSKLMLFVEQAIEVNPVTKIVKREKLKNVPNRRKSIFHSITKLKIKVFNQLKPKREHVLCGNLVG